jgi:uncharacterized protein YneF (UPF0154 family)
MGEAYNARSESQSSTLRRSAEDQIRELMQTIEDQDAQVWAYLLGGIVALVVGVIAAYYYSQMVRERRKSTLEKIKDALRGGIG